MDLFEAIQARRSVRKYIDREVPQELIGRLLEAARLAPSSSNTQSWKFVVVTDRETRARMKELAFGQRFVEQAPVVIACCMDLEAFGERGRRTLELVLKGKVRPSLEMMLRAARGSRDREPDPERVMVNGAVNVAIAGEHIALAATALGLGTCWVRAFQAPQVEALLGLPESLKALALLTVGYPAESPPARPRRPLEEISMMGPGR